MSSVTEVKNRWRNWTVVNNATNLTNKSNLLDVQYTPSRMKILGDTIRWLVAMEERNCGCWNFMMMEL